MIYHSHFYFFKQVVFTTDMAKCIELPWSFSAIIVIG